MKRLLATLLACIMLCGLAWPTASAAEKTITSVETVGNNVFDCCAELGIWTSLEVSISLLVRYSDGSTSNETQPLWVSSVAMETGLHEFIGFYQPGETPDNTHQFTFFINAISVRDLASADPLRLNQERKTNGNQLECFSYTPAKTEWVNIAVAPPVNGQYAACYVFDETCSRIGYRLSSGSSVNVKMTAGKTYYLAVTSPPAKAAITLSPSEAPVLQQKELKLWTTKSGGNPIQPFQQEYLGVTFTVNGEAAPAHGFRYTADQRSVSVAPNTAAGTYTLRFTSHDGEDLGTLTVILEDMTFRSWLSDILTGFQTEWANEDKTTREWLTSIGNDIMLLLGAPVIALMILFCGPMGWLLFPIVFQPFIQLPVDIIGFFSSLF